MELLRTSGGRVFFLIARLSPGLGFALAFWVVHVWVFSGSPSRSECSVLCFRHGCDVVLRDLLCSSVSGLHCTGPANARQIAWENFIACGGGQVFLVRLGRRIVGGACRSYLPQVVAGRWDRRSQSPSGSGCLGPGVLALGHETVCFVSLGPVALVLSLRVFFVKNLLSSWYLGVGLVLALTLARLLLRDFGPLVPRPLLPGLWSLGSSPPSTGSVVAVLVLGCPVLLAWTYHCFSLGAWSLDLASSSVTCHPSPSHGLARLGGLCMSPLFEMLSVLFPGNIGSHFLGISRSVFGSI